MSKGAHLTLRPDRCNLCGQCVSACPNNAVRVGDGYILIDWKACNQCCACVDVCAPAAIQREITPTRAGAAVAAVAPTDVSKVVVGSRAEAKAMRKAAEKAAKQSSRFGMRAAGSPRSAVPPAPASPMRMVDATDAAAAGGEMIAAEFMAGGVSAGAASAAPPAAPVAVTADGYAPAAPAIPDSATPAAASSAAGALRATRRTEPAPVVARAASAGWTLVDVALVLAVLALTIVGKNAALAIPAIGLMPASGRSLAHAGVLALFYGIQFGAFVFLAGRHAVPTLVAFGVRRDPDAPADDGGAFGSAMTSVVLVIGLLIATELFALGYGLAMQAIGWRQPLSAANDVAATFGAGGAGVMLSSLLVGFVAPVAEEFAFRSVVLGALSERFGIWLAIAISSVLFAAYHVNLWLVAPMLVLGVATGWLAATRRSLWPAIVLHVLYNGLAVAAAYLVVPK